MIFYLSAKELNRYGLVIEGTLRNLRSKGQRKTNLQKQRSLKTSGRSAQQKGGAHQGVKKKAPIPLRVLAVLSLPMVILHVINAVFLSTFYSILSLGFIILYFIAGYIGGNYWFADHPRFPRGAKPKAVQEGAACGLTLGVINLIILVVFGSLVSFVSLGLGTLFAGLNILLCAPTEVFTSLIMGALGGWLSERSR